MPDRAGHFASFPDRIELSLDEIAVVLGALDAAAEGLPDPDRSRARKAVGVITAKLWPELGDLLAEEEPDGGKTDDEDTEGDS